MRSLANERVDEVAHTANLLWRVPKSVEENFDNMKKVFQVDQDGSLVVFAIPIVVWWGPKMKTTPRAKRQHNEIKKKKFLLIVLEDDTLSHRKEQLYYCEMCSPPSTLLHFGQAAQNHSTWMPSEVSVFLHFFSPLSFLFALLLVERACLLVVHS